MRMLEDLRKVMRKIKADDVAAHDFIQRIAVKKEYYPEIPINKNAFKHLTALHFRYCKK